jgi:hypothetical protein
MKQDFSAVLVVITSPFIVIGLIALLLHLIHAMHPQ